MTATTRAAVQDRSVLDFLSPRKQCRYDVPGKSMTVASSA